MPSAMNLCNMNKLSFLPLAATILLCLPHADATTPTQLTNLPSVYLYTNNGASIDHDTYVSGTITVVDAAHPENCMTDEPMQIRGRGNSTWRMDKKPYSIKLGTPSHFLGCPANAATWEFIANYADKSMLRGATAFHLSEWIGLEFSPATAFADVYLNDKYIGNYHITDHMEIGADRVPVEVQDASTTDNITGGYFLEVDGWATSEPHYFTTNHDMPVTIHYPEKISSKQTRYIQSIVQGFETKLFSSNFKDAEKGYRTAVDTVSLIKWYVAIELVGNPDAFWSTFMYKKKDNNRLFFGPMWDYDIAFNNDNRLGNATKKTMREDAHNPKTWIQQLWKDEWFRHASNQCLKQWIKDGVEDELCQYVDSMANVLDASQAKNYERWNVLSTRVYREVNLYNTYKEYVDYLKTYIHQRIIFLSENFQAEDPYPTETSTEQTKAEPFYYSAATHSLCFPTAKDRTITIYSAGGAKLQTLQTQGTTAAIPDLPHALYLIAADGELIKAVL